MSSPAVPESLYTSSTIVEFPGDWQVKRMLQPQEPFDYTTPNRPALAGWFKNKIWCVYRHGYKINSLYYTTAEHSEAFSPEKEILGCSTLQGPALVVFNDILYCVFTNSNDSNRLYYTVFINDDWTKPLRLRGYSSAQSPALAVFNGKLWCVHTGSQKDQNLYCTTFNGNAWSSDQKLSNHASAAGPALAASASTLLCVHRGADNDESLWYTTSDGSAWKPDRQIAVGIVGNKLYSGGDGPALAYDPASNTFGLVYKGQDSENDTLLYYTVAGSSDWAFPSRLHTFNSLAGPALIAYPTGPQNKFMVMFRGVKQS
ncbi:hypothetical protein [Burkholderia sp. TSV86]|uniref:hypothetical protein n=1 Tax=Burkholderia sp. TSV86 TaxID=1385594 RepID=UPI000B2FD5CD|nr:hypothetical protein [Burkholderia sp. TSV86]